MQPLRSASTGFAQRLSPLSSTAHLANRAVLHRGHRFVATGDAIDPSALSLGGRFPALHNHSAMAPSQFRTGLPPSRSLHLQPSQDVSDPDRSSRLSLGEFTAGWDAAYRAQLEDVALFQPGVAQQLSREQQQRFAKVFLHIRGHFHDFLWILGTRAPDDESRRMILDNIAGEFGLGADVSHEALYQAFAKAVGVDLADEYVTQAHYLPFVRDFNQGHLRWLHQHDWIGCLAAFAAYEKLDNTDYTALHRMAAGFGVPDAALAFFRVHANVGHYDAVKDPLAPVWTKHRSSVEAAFKYIGTHQLKMWHGLSDLVVGERESGPLIRPA